MFCIAALLYYLAFKTPNADIVLFFSAGVIFLLAGASGLSGYGDFETKVGITKVNDSYYEVAGINTNSPYYNTYFPMFSIILGLYVILNSAFALRNGNKPTTKEF
jgi:hypothetical protein